MPDNAKWYASFAKAFRWGCYIASHALVTLFLIAVIEIIQRVLIYLGDPTLFDRIPVRYVLDVMELGILLVFVVVGTMEAIRVFRED